MSERGLCPPQCAKNVNPTRRKSLNPLCEGTEEGIKIEAQPGGGRLRRDAPESPDSGALCVWGPNGRDRVTLNRL